LNKKDQVRTCQNLQQIHRALGQYKSGEDDRSNLPRKGQCDIQLERLFAFWFFGDTFQPKQRCFDGSPVGRYLGSERVTLQPFIDRD